MWGLLRMNSNIARNGISSPSCCSRSSWASATPPAGSSSGRTPYGQLETIGSSETLLTRAEASTFWVVPASKPKRVKVGPSNQSHEKDVAIQHSHELIKKLKLGTTHLVGEERGEGGNPQNDTPQLKQGAANASLCTPRAPCLPRLP